MGVEALCWTEYIRTLPELEEHAWPRYVAKAETGWSINKGDYKEFVGRLKTLYPYLKKTAPNAAGPKRWTHGLFVAAKEMLSFGRNFTGKKIQSFADAQKEV